jgi:tetratricopeptide (TPR) repeat protein
MSSADNPKPEQASTGGWYLRLSGVVTHAWKFSTRATFAVLVLLLIIPLYSAVFDKSFVIGEFSVPDELQKKGATSGVIGRRFFDHIADMQHYANSAVAESHFGPQAFASAGASSKVTDIKLPGADISLVSLISQLRALLHIQDTKIVGEVVISKNAPEVTYVLRAHATGGDVWVEAEEGTDIDAVIRTVATRLVERFDPLVAGFYYFRNPEKRDLDRAIGFAEGFHSTDKRQEAWALVLRGLAWRDKQKDSQQTRVSLCNAIDRDRSFTPAWRILARTLREDDDIARARHLALRLVQHQPDEPEGYRQLGSLRRDCMAGPEQEQQAESLFKRAIGLGAERETDSLSLVDYARFRYEWYRPEPSGEVPGYDAMGDHLKAARSMARDEPSVYTTWARALAHPRSPGESRTAGDLSRLLDAELKAQYALTRDSTSAFANFAMGELLTDKGVERHKYRDVDSFTKAKDFLETSRRGVVHPELLEDPLYARALAGAGDFFPAEEILKDIEAKAKARGGSPNPVAEWVYGEMLYNQDRYEEALAHLNAAENVRTCGPRSNVVRSLITIIENKLANQPPANTDESEPMRAKLVAHSMVTRRSAATGRPAKREVKELPTAEPACPGWEQLTGDELSPWWPARPGWSFFEAG